MVSIGDQRTVIRSIEDRIPIIVCVTSVSLPISIEIDSPGSGEAPDMLDILTTTEAPVAVTPRNIEFFLAREYADMSGIKMTTEVGPAGMVITAARA